MKNGYMIEGGKKEARKKRPRQKVQDNLGVEKRSEGKKGKRVERAKICRQTSCQKASEAKWEEEEAKESKGNKKKHEMQNWKVF
jgi:hypothetical protein